MALGARRAYSEHVSIFEDARSEAPEQKGDVDTEADEEEDQGYEHRLAALLKAV